MLLHKVFRVVVVATTFLFLAGCEKDTTDDVSTVLKVPAIEVVGGEFVSVAVGADYVDQGAKYTGEDGSVTDLQASDPVNINTSQPGLYFINYEQTSASGIFETQATRVVAVSYRENPADYSGAYHNAAYGGDATITQLAPGLYRLKNPFGYPGHEVVELYFIETALNSFEGPMQPNQYVGDIGLADITFTSTGASWKVLGDFYPNNQLTFVKQ